jgi:hypothetical protein
VEQNRGNHLRITPRDTARVPDIEVHGPPIRDHAGRILTPGNRGVYAFADGRWTNVAGKESIWGLRELAVDTAGGLWSWNRAGLVKIHRDRFEPVSEGDLTLKGALYADRQGRVWLGYEQLLLLYQDGRVRRFRADEPDWPGMVLDFLEVDGGLWVATPLGLSKFVNDRFQVMPANQALPGRYLTSLQDDAEGNWWVLTNSSLFRLPRGEPDRALRDTAYRMRYQRFDEADGWPGLLVNGETGPLLARAHDGRIWLATDGGLASIDPGDDAFSVGAGAFSLSIDRSRYGLARCRDAPEGLLHRPPPRPLHLPRVSGAPRRALE